MDLPKISLITVNYNKGDFIEDTIVSVINQDYPNLEYIIIDGASTDNSVEIINKYQKHLSYFVSEPDKGMTDALIKGYTKATGEIFAWINSDDVFLPGALKLVAEKYQKTKFDFLYGDCYLINANGNRTKRLYSLPTNSIAQALGVIPLFQPSCFWSKEIYTKIGGLDRAYFVTMDGNLFYNILKESKNTIRVNSPLSCFRIHPNQSNVWAPAGRYIQERQQLNSYVNELNPISKLYYKKLFKLTAIFKRIINNICRK